MNTKEIKSMVQALAPVIKEFVEAATGPLHKRIADLEARQPERGEKGADGRDGASVSIADVEPIIADAVQRAVSALPAARDGRDGEDGRSLTADDIAPLVAQEVSKAVAELPVPADGKDGRDGVDGTAPSEEDIALAVTRHLTSNPPPAGKDGVDGSPGRDGSDGNDGLPGRDGLDGKDAAPLTDASVDDAVRRWMALNPPAAGRDGLDGADGKDAEPPTEAVLAAIVARHLEAHPPRPGNDGRDGVDGTPGRDGLDGKDGRDGVDGSAGKAGADGKDGRDGISGKDGRDGVDGIAGKDGADGRDGVGLAGALIDRAGHLVVTLTNGETRELGPVIGRDGRDGEHGASGRDGFSLKDFDAELMPDGRTVLLKFGDGSDTSFAAELSFPVVLDRGVFKESAEYVRGDGVTWGGSFWIAQATTTAKPGDDETWRLAVKRGRDGKEAVSVKRDPQAPVKL